MTDLITSLTSNHADIIIAILVVGHIIALGWIFNAVKNNNNTPDFKGKLN